MEKIERLVQSRNRSRSPHEKSRNQVLESVLGNREEPKYVPPIHLPPGQKSPAIVVQKDQKICPDVVFKQLKDWKKRNNDDDDDDNEEKMKLMRMMMLMMMML